MNDKLPIFYVSLLLAILSAIAIFIFRQIFRTRRIESRFDKLQTKLQKEAGDPKEYYELASLYLDKKLYVKAIQLLQRALKVGETVEPENQALVYNALGFAYAAQEQYDLAIRQYKEAIKLNADYPTAYNNLGSVYEKKKLTAQALEAYEASLQVEPDNKTAKRRAEALRKRFSPASSS
ncbi:MAG: tetratricopeptide repeat protein [Spirulinaceae cyanobacterium SM2_1_0]|nr:tetratricopeptide repeat protein [Spirulinaceae cyanobacterium SM2_1_0]